MDEETANRFVSSLVKSIQALCNGYIDFSTSIEVIGHIHLNIDHNLKFNYILTEEVSKSVSEGATVFASHSYHSQPPPSVSSKTAGDASSRNRRKSHHVTQSNETDPLGITSLPAEVPNTSKSKSDNHSQGASRVGESSDSSQSGTGVSQDTDSVKQENNRSSCQVQESLDRRRRNALPSHRTPSPAAKRSRNNDTGSSTSVQNPGFDVIEIKEEPDDEPSVFFGDNSSHMAVGQDIQTPDFSNVVMESLDRVGQIEGNQLVAGGDSMQQQQQQQPFPVMLHTNAGIPSSTMSSSGGQAPGPSSDPRSTASTSGEDLSSFSRRSSCGGSPPSSHSPSWGLNPALSPFNPLMMPRMQHPAFSALPRQMWMSASLASYRPRPRLQYSQSQITAAILDVEMGKSISKAAKDNGVPFTSLYRKVKARSLQQAEDEPQLVPVEESAPYRESLPAEEPAADENAFPAEEPPSEENLLLPPEGPPPSEENPLPVEEPLIAEDPGSLQDLSQS